MKKLTSAVMLTVLLAANVQADTVGLYLGGQIWQSEISGAFGEKNALTDFDLKNEQQANYFIAIEHPLPFLPNVRISSTTLDTTGKTNSAQAFSFREESFIANDRITASYDASYIDYTFYYELFDSSEFSFDLGLTARDFDIVSAIKSENTHLETEVCYGSDPGVCIITPVLDTPSDKVGIDVIESMLYVAANIGLPLSGLSVFANGDFLLFSNHSTYDYQAGLNYSLIRNMTMDFSLNLGYKVVKMEFEDLDDLYTDLEFKGVFVGAIAHF